MHSDQTARFLLETKSGVPLRVASLQQGRPCFVVQLQQRFDARPPHGHLHRQVEQPRIAMSHFTSSEQLLNDALAGGVVRNAERFVLDVLAQARRIDFDGGLWNGLVKAGIAGRP